MVWNARCSNVNFWGGLLPLPIVGFCEYGFILYTAFCESPALVMAVLFLYGILREPCFCKCFAIVGRFWYLFNG